MATADEEENGVTADDEVYTVQEIAKKARVDEATVRRWIGKRELPAYEFPSGKGKQSIFRILRTDWERFLDGSRRERA